MTIHVIVGPPAAGKTTYVDDNAADGDIIVDYDRIAFALNSRTEHGAAPPIKDVTITARAAVIDAILANDWPAWIIHGNPSDEQVETYMQAGAEFDLIDPGRETTIERAKKDNRDEQTFDLIDAWYESPPQLADSKKSQKIPEQYQKFWENVSTPEKGARRMLTKTIRTSIKANAVDDDDGNGKVEFAGYASVFDNIDLGGDKIIKGAFKNALADRYPDGGAGVPVYWNHDVDDPFKNLGLTSKAVEDDHGLYVEGEIDQSTELGQQVAKLLKAGRVNQMSFAYDVRDGAWVEGKKRDDGSYEPGYYELRDLDLYEVSICPIGMNQETEVAAKKAMLGLDPDQEPEHKSEEVLPPATPLADMAARRLQLINI